MWLTTNFAVICRLNLKKTKSDQVYPNNYFEPNMIIAISFSELKNGFLSVYVCRRKYEIAVAPIPDSNDEKGDNDSSMPSTFECEHEIEATPSIAEIPRKI